MELTHPFNLGSASKPHGFSYFYFRSAGITGLQALVLVLGTDLGSTTYAARAFLKEPFPLQP